MKFLMDPRDEQLDQRRWADRRTRPTTLWSALRWHGRRVGFRRAGEGHQAYVDGLAWHIVGLAVLVSACSSLDALLTLLYVQGGGSEANPLMHLTLMHSSTLFLVCKVSLTVAGVWVLAAHQQWPLATSGLYGLALLYGLLLVYHLLFYVSGA
jgi:uncharacterized protein DUF5658